MKTYLKQRRILLGITQKSISSKLGITQSQYSRLEKWQSNPTKYFNRIAKILKCDVQDLYEPMIQNRRKNETLTYQAITDFDFIFRTDSNSRVFLNLQPDWYKIQEIENLLKKIMLQNYLKRNIQVF